MKQAPKPSLLRIAWAFAFAAWMVLRSGAQSGVSVAPPPDWVRETEWTPAGPSATQADLKGKRYLLYEVQERPARAEEFSRVAVLMVNETGVQDSGNLRFEFDPVFQEILLHRVTVHRDGRSRSRLDPEKVRVIQPEPGLDDHLITGRQNAVVIVDDLRVGDVLEYAYTVRGANPVLANHYANRFQIQSDTPVDRELFRVVWDGPGELRMRGHRVHVEPLVSPWPGGADYVWSFSQLAAIPSEDLQPPGFEPFPYLELSDFADWGEVVDWALPLYALPDGELPREVRDLTAGWRAAGGSAEERARMAVQFVQDDLRYTGLELGPDSHRPAAPLETLERRYGDCKGKVALLRLLLHALEIESQPALVNSAAYDGIAQRLPSPFAFNHVILRILLDGRVVWVDPTLSHQGGTLWSRYLPPYGKALVIRPGSRGLDDVPQVPPELAFQQSVTSVIRIADYNAPAAFTVQTAFQGASADRMREHFARTDRAELAERYLNFYARSYPEIGAAGPLEVTDDRIRNRLLIEESYRITNLWRRSESSRRLEAFFFADNLSSALPDPETRIRKTPLRLTYPMQRQQEIRVHLPDSDWEIPSAEQLVEHEGFFFRYRRDFSGSTAQFFYECTTRRPDLPPELVPGYLTKREEMENQLADSLDRPDPDAGDLATRINWLTVCIALLGVGGSAAAAAWYWHRTSSSPSSSFGAPPVMDLRWQGLGGWLILVGLGLCVAPLLRIADIASSWEGFFSVEVWQDVAMPDGGRYHPLFGPLLILELLGNAVLLVINLLAIGLYFARRQAFPRVYIALLVLNAVFLIFDDLASARIPALQADPSGHRGAIRGTVNTVVWTLYMLRSRRVRATFVR